MDGILIVDKPKGITSFDVVDFIKKRFHIKAGHAGTLDPQATGLLIILVGRLTKYSKEFTSYDKEYEACLTLGVATDSLDGQGRIIKRERLPDYNPEQIEKTFQHFLGKIEQIPPMFSALRYRGRRLYTLARQGLEVQRPPRRVYIYDLKITRISLPHIYFKVNCSKGTYIRTLCADIAKRLNCVGHLSELRRTRSGPFTIQQAVSLDRLRQCPVQKLKEFLLEKF